ncbi:hypothetical protein H9L21_14695 [Aeromicrobium senzhongii]|uniref:O-antigen ligase domain-containing protein n=1 Tax=Aeromicrobium senzhongii TaxID=2663859 RepID=A0ABX6SSC3_9ACTN|nr:hypothetical protein [Aeromicrobium senzhongii]MTB89566.1 hypothetical protein [Aeromicrobium senzhongii]QNL94306.1 hypothetical protein H9L21_14695 [Aeromicrobium senzhongii]
MKRSVIEPHPTSRRDVDRPRPGILPSAATIAVLYAALCPLLIIPAGTQSFGSVDLLLALGVFSVLRGLGGAPRLPSLLLLGCFVVSLIGSVVHLIADAPSDVVFVGRMWAIYLPFLVVMGAPAIDRIALKRIFATVVASSTIACLAGIGLYHAGIQVRDSQQVNWYGGGLGSSLRAGGLLGNTGDFGHLSAILAIAALGYMMMFGRHVLMSVIVAMAVYATFLSSSRAALLHVLVALAVLLAMSSVAKKLVAAFCALLAIFAVYILFVSSSVDPRMMFTLRRLDVFNLSGESLFYATPRFQAWEMLVGWIPVNPIVGIGYGQTIAVTGRVGDNSLLTLFVELGVVFGVMLTAFWLVLVAEGFRAAPSVRRLAVAIVVSELAHMITVDTHRMWTTTPLTLILVAALLRYSSGVVHDRSVLGETPADADRTDAQVV